ncbi:hypothetical protein QTJ16_006221 [Diplocarpon rosae]|uniref:Uncharacterized protein n=1 Tax=Diplocarpon rosae TaxID=946125 RepID=A0AAD9WCD2_9HELO|nr:hypothetical protein QTJ16_006221 [Diplocarpon rosae]
MASAEQARIRSRDRYASDHSPSQPASASSTPKAGTKRLFSKRNSRQQYDGDNEEESVDEGEEVGGGGGEGEGEPECHSDKRHRSRDWPLVNASPSSIITPRPAVHHSHSRKTNSPSSRRRRAPIASSKFVEGSMNDRVSQKPPVPYLDPADEGSLAQHGDAGCGDGARGRKLTRGRLTHHPNHSLAETSANAPDPSRSSSIFRFGKSIAATFNPTNWKFWTKEEQAADDEEAAQLRILQERQAKAEKIYQELKESGHFRDSAVAPMTYPPSSSGKRSAAKHDSGIEFNDVESSSARDSTSIDEKRKGRVFLEPPRFQPRGESPGSGYDGSMAPSNTSTPCSKPRFNFKTPSLADLKRASLSNIKSAFTSESTSSNLGLGIGTTDHQARRVPSRRDMQKQLKLVKRVSNLEERLKQARQQLAEALHEPIPIESHVSFAQHASQVSFASQQAPTRVTRPKFVPGAMPSLPSERLLSGYVSSEAGRSDEEMGSEIGQAVSIDHPAPFMPGAADGENDAVERTSSLVLEDHTQQSVEGEDMVSLEFKLTDESTPTKPVSSLEVGEATPKPGRPPAAFTKKRKSTVQDGDYIPVDASESDSNIDGESDIRSEVPSMSGPAPKTLHTSLSKNRGATITLLHPKKIQKTAQGARPSGAVPTKKSHSALPAPKPASNAKSQLSENISPPTRTAPAPPPPPALGRSPTKKPSFSSHAPSRLPSIAPDKPLSATASRLQSASPPPSSATFTGPTLSHTRSSSAPKVLDAPNLPRISIPKAGRQRTADRVEQGSDNGNEVPPMPPMPKAVRLASGEVICTAGYVAPRKVKGVKPPSVAGDRKNDGGPETREHAEGEGGREHQGTGMSGSLRQESFEWPDDVF